MTGLENVNDRSALNKIDTPKNYELIRPTSKFKFGVSHELPVVTKIVHYLKGQLFI